MSDWDLIRSFLEEPEHYGPEVAQVIVIETTLSVVFLAGDLAYKLRKPVLLSHVDFSTCAGRRTDAEAEFTLNRRTSSDLYVALRSVGVKDGVCQWLTGGDTLPAAELLVVMRRFDGEDLLRARIISEDVTPELLRSVGQEIAAFHRAQPEIGRNGSAVGMISAVEQVLSSFREAPISEVLHQHMARVGHTLRCAVAEVAHWIKVRPLKDLHGDLHAANICICDGKPVLFDCVEYSDAFRQIDPMQDLAFLFMDLHALGRTDLAYVMLNEYLELTDDYGGLRILKVAAAYYALVRAMVHAIGPTPDSGLIERYISCAEQFLAPAEPYSVLVGGLSGTGKSTVARGLAEHRGLIHVRSDAVRKNLMGLQRTVLAPPYAYSDAMSTLTYLKVAEQTILAQSAGFATVTDAVFQRQAQRALFSSLKELYASVPQYPIWLSLSPDEAGKRIKGRSGDVSDADCSVLESQLRLGTDSDWPSISADGSPQEVLERALLQLEAVARG